MCWRCLSRGIRMEIHVYLYEFPYKKMHLKISSAKYPPVCSSLNVLKLITTNSINRRLTHHDSWPGGSNSVLPEKAHSNIITDMKLNTLGSGNDIWCQIMRWPFIRVLETIWQLSPGPSHVRHGVYNHGRLYSLFNSFVRLTAKEAPKLCILSICGRLIFVKGGESTGDRWISLSKDQ